MWRLIERMSNGYVAGGCGQYVWWVWSVGMVGVVSRYGGCRQ